LAYFKIKKIVESLIETYKCDTNIRENLGNTAFIIACANGFVEIACK